MENSPIIIAGFGRSGTTWLSDIISKSLGGLILFEPFHPGIYDESKSICYSGKLENAAAVKNHIDKCASHSPENLWLLRNHLNTPLESNTPSFVKYVWGNSKVLGFKTIRTVHLLSSLQRLLSARSIYIYRHPFAVLCSINNRDKFWKEYGWQWHVEHFFKRALSMVNLTPIEIQHFEELKEKYTEKNEAILIMWALSFVLGLREIKKADGYKLSYESLYLHPYERITELLNFLKMGDIRLHPSYFFTPSMTTLSTLHALKKNVRDRRDLDKAFWSTKIDAESTKRYYQLIQELLSIDSEAQSLAIEEEYIFQR